jgi:hypothetical protein
VLAAWQVVFETLSPGKRHGGMVRKFQFYERYGVEEYYVYDPDHNTLDGWLRRQALREIANMSGWRSPRLGIRFELHDDCLKLFHPDGRPFLTPLEIDQQRREAEERAQEARLRDGGLRIGLTLSGPNQADVLRRAMDVTVAGRRLFECVQATWNLLEPSAGLALQAAHEAGLGVIVKEALANGRLTARNRDSAFAANHRILQEVTTRMRTTLDALALAAALAQPCADVVRGGHRGPSRLQRRRARLELGPRERG